MLGVSRSWVHACTRMHTLLLEQVYPFCYTQINLHTCTYMSPSSPLHLSLSLSLLPLPPSTPLSSSLLSYPSLCPSLSPSLPPSLLLSSLSLSLPLPPPLSHTHTCTCTLCIYSNTITWKWTYYIILLNAHTTYGSFAGIDDSVSRSTLLCLWLQ